MSTSGKYVDAAGGVVWRHRDGERPEFLVVHRPRYDDWSLPKGKNDRDESFEACARREVLEETGYTVKMGDAIGAIAYRTPGDNAKRVRYWLMQRLDGSFSPNSEVDRIEWLRPKKARARLTYARDRTVFDRGLLMIRRPASGRAYLVRHALAGDRKQWKGNDKKRQLSQRGTKQARALADNLSSLPITDVLSSKWARSSQTVAPLAETLGLSVEHHKAFAEGASPKALDGLIKEMAGKVAVLCTHGDVVEAYLEHLAAAGVKRDGPPKWKKASTWVLETRKGKVTNARYLPPPGTRAANLSSQVTVPRTISAMTSSSVRPERFGTWNP